MNTKNFALLILGFSFLTTHVYSQWTATGSNIYYNAGSVGIGNSAIDISGTALDQLVVGDGIGSRGIVIYHGDTYDGGYAFANSTGNLTGRLLYDSSDDKIKLQYGGSDRLTYSANDIELLKNTRISEDLTVSGQDLFLGGSATKVSGSNGYFTIFQNRTDWTNSTNHPIFQFEYNTEYNDNIYIASGGNTAITSQQALIVSESKGVVIGRSGIDTSTWDSRLSRTDFVVDRGGKVGIGTSSPEQKLHVNEGNVLIELDSQYSYDPMISFENDGSEANLFQTFYRWSGVDDKYHATRILHAGNSGFKIQSASSAPYGNHVFNDSFTLLSNGKVGIGTSNPDQTLTVKGKIHSEEIIVDLNVPGPDYVFESDYDLPTLAELEAFIQANKHLPEIPSAATMEEEGIVSGEMNMLLLKKIEEMTLHLIDIQKQVNALKEENEQLKAQIE